MAVEQSFRTNLWMEFLFLMSSSRATLESYQSRSLIVFYEYLSHHNETIHHHQYSSFLTNMTVRQSFSTKLEIFEVQSFSSWCHHQGQPWRRGSSVSFLILMSYQSRSLIVFYEYLSHHNETIHDHQYSSFLTNMRDLRSAEFLFLMSSSGATLEMRVKCVVSDLDVISKQPSDRLQWDELHLSLSFTELSIIINRAVFWLTSQWNRVSWLTYEWSFSFWCHHQGQPWSQIKAGLW